MYFRIYMKRWIFTKLTVITINVIIMLYTLTWASLVAQRLKRLPGMQETWVRSLGQEDPLEKEIAVLLPGESHGGRSLVGYSPWGRKESDKRIQMGCLPKTLGTDPRAGRLGSKGPPRGRELGKAEWEREGGREGREAERVGDRGRERWVRGGGWSPRLGLSFKPPANLAGIPKILGQGHTSPGFQDASSGRVFQGQILWASSRDLPRQPLSQPDSMWTHRPGIATKANHLHVSLWSSQCSDWAHPCHQQQPPPPPHPVTHRHRDLIYLQTRSWIRRSSGFEVHPNPWLFSCEPPWLGWETWVAIEYTAKDGCGCGVVVRSFLFNSLGPVQSEKRSASHRASPALPHAASFLLCLLLPPDFLLLLLSALRFFKEAHILSMSRCWHRSGLCSVQNVHASFLGLVECPS